MGMVNQSLTLIIEHPSGNSISNTISKLERTDLGIQAVVFSCEAGIAAIHQLNPQLVILETELPDGNGFKILDDLKMRGFDLIICSGDARNRERASCYNASAFLMSPYLAIQAEQALVDFQYKTKPIGLESVFKRNQTWQSCHKLDSLALYSKEGFHFIPLERIVRTFLRAGQQIVELASGEQIVSENNLVDFGKILVSQGFLQMGKGLRVNPMHISGICPGKPERILLSNGREIVYDVRKFNPKP